MKINRDILHQALTRVKPGLETGKEYIEQMKHVFFDGEDIATYNDHIAILLPFETDFNTSVRFEDLYKAVKDTFATVEEIDISMNKKKQLILQADEKTKVGLTTTEEDELGDMLKSIKNQLPNDKNKFEWTPLPEDFLDAIGLCAFAASSNMMLGPLTCIRVQEDGISSSDNYRVSWYQFDNGGTIPDADFLIQATDAKELLKFPVEDMCISDSWCHFITDSDIVFSTRLVQDEPMDLRSVFLKEREGIELTFPDSLKEKVENMLFLTDGDTQLDKFIDMQLSKNSLLCKTNSERGFVEQKVKVDYVGDDKLLYINPVFLAQMLARTTTILIGEDRSFLQAGNFQHMLMHKVFID